MKVFIALIISLLISNLGLAQFGGYQGTGYQGGGGGYGDMNQQVDPNKPAGPPTGDTRKDLMAPMDTTSPTKLSDYEKCKSDCDMTFINCYRVDTDRAKCYSTQQECLGKCGGDPETTPDYGSPLPQGGGQLGF